MTPLQLWEEMRRLSVKMPWRIGGKWGSCSFLLITAWVSSFHVQFRQDIAGFVCLCVLGLMKLLKIPSTFMDVQDRNAISVEHSLWKYVFFLTSLVLGTRSSTPPFLSLFHLFSSYLFYRADIWDSVIPCFGAHPGHQRMLTNSWAAPSRCQ
jgi:hypothetical protein